MLGVVLVENENPLAALMGHPVAIFCGNLEKVLRDLNEAAPAVLVAGGTALVVEAVVAVDAGCMPSDPYRGI